MIRSCKGAWPYKSLGPYKRPQDLPASSVLWRHGKKTIVNEPGSKLSSDNCLVKICQHLDLGLLSLQKCEIHIFVNHPALWYFLIISPIVAKYPLEFLIPFLSSPQLKLTVIKQNGITLKKMVNLQKTWIAQNFWGGTFYFWLDTGAQMALEAMAYCFLFVKFKDPVIMFH